MIPFLTIVAAMAWVGVMFIPGPYKYRAGDCIGITGTVVAQVMDRKNGAYVLDMEPTRKEVHRGYAVWSKDVTEDTTDLVLCPERRWKT